MDWNYLTDALPRGKPVSGRWRYEGTPCPYRIIDEARLTTVPMTLPIKRKVNTNE